MNPQVFRHLWFIGVLMQFYVIVPFIVWLMWKLRQTKLSSLIPLGLAAFSSIAMWVMYVPKGDPTRVYFGTDTHSMGLMLGVALAWWVTAPQLGHARQRAVPMPRTISSSASAAAHRLRYLGFPWSIASGMRRHRYWRSSADCLGHHGGYRQTGCIRLPRWHHIVQLVVRAADCRYHLRRFLDAKPHGVQAIGLPRQVFVRHLLWHWPLWILSSALARRSSRQWGLGLSS